MRRFRRHHSETEVALANFALTFAKALLVISVALFLLISPERGKDGVKPKAEYLITIEWTGKGNYDVDSWTRLPDGTRVGYSNKESGVVFLERDDLGNDCNETTASGTSLNTCEEITVIRGIVPGEYEFGVHLFSANGTGTNTAIPPVQIHVKVEKLNPETKIVFQTTVTLETIRQEKPVVRFAVNPDASISNVSTDDLAPIVYPRD